MAKNVRLKFKRAAIREILISDAAVDLVKAEGQRVADACNAQSSWGGYGTAASADATRARARVWSYDGRNDEARDQRLLRNL